MIRKISSRIDNKILEEIVEIHHRCILMTNSKYYNSKQIGEWISVINTQSIKSQIAKSLWIVMENYGKIVGFAQYSLKDEVLYQIQIDPNEQKKGYGKMLYKYIENDFRESNISNISLFATLNAISFYKDLGFNIIKEKLFKLTDTEIKMVEMSKKLD